MKNTHQSVKSVHYAYILLSDGNKTSHCNSRSLSAENRRLKNHASSKGPNRKCCSHELCRHQRGRQRCNEIARTASTNLGGFERRGTGEPWLLIFF